MSGSILVSDVIERAYAAELDRIAPDFRRIVLTPEGPDGPVDDVEIFFFSTDLYPERAAQCMQAAFGATNLRWLHTFSAGIDHPVFRSFLERGVRLSHSAGAAAEAIAHTVMLFILALSRRWPAAFDVVRAKQWKQGEADDLGGRLVVVAGMGHIGSQVARLAHAFGMKVIGIRRRPRGDEPAETWPSERLDEALAAADYVVLALPLTNSTRRILDRRRIALLRPEARLINVGRGELVDEAALVEALASGRLAGAALDVFEEEPLPTESPLWTLPNVIVTPHTAGLTPGSAANAVEIFLDNLGRYLRGEPLRNEVTLEQLEGD